MPLLSEYFPLILYFSLFIGLKISQHAVLIRPESHIQKGWGDWTVWGILLPLWLVLFGPVMEFLFLGHRPGLWQMISGGGIFIAAGFFSIKGYLALQQGFIQGIEHEDTSLVVRGLYHVIRHPISLGNILFCIACPVFLAAGPSWIPALIGVLGITIRISIEESYLQAHIPDYESYKAKTWALIPYIY
jgi:protein-S-isoprenylcysteine O-methyltransferase Ste14